MKITIEKSYFTKALATASRAVSSRSTMPILSNVLIETDDDVIRITATDLDSAITVTAPAQVIENGAVAIPAALLNEIVSKLGDAPISLELKDGKVKVRSGKSEYSLLSLPAADYPVIPRVKNGYEFSMSHRAFKTALSGVAFCASKEETRSILMGVLFDLRDDKATFVATDAHRLAKYDHHFAEAIGVEPTSTIIPVKPLLMVLATLGDNGEEVVSVRVGDAQVQFETADVVLVTRVLDGQFPNYEKVIPKSFERRATIGRAALLGALRRVFIVAKNNNEKAVFSFAAGGLTVTASSSETGTACEEIECECDGEITIALNVRYFVEFLASMNCEAVTVQLGSPLNPITLTGDGGDWLGILMPMQV